MNPLKKLAGETAIYGTSTVVARVLNFFCLPLYTYMLSRADFGVITWFLAVIAILQVMLTLGLETGSFRYANKHDNPQQVFSAALATVLAACVVVLIGCVCFAKPIAQWLGYGEYSICIMYMGAVLAIDCFTAILFARLRYEHKAAKFATFKIIKISTELGANLLLFLVMPAYFAAQPDSWLLNFVAPTPHYTYMLFAVFVSCVVALLLFVPDLLRIRFKFSRTLWRELLWYSLPLMIAGLPGVANDFIDRLLFQFYAPVATPWREQLGVYQAGVKLAVIMTLFVQMFRYAAEPFFFAGAKDKNSPKLYADVMHHFTAFCMVIFLFVLFYLDAFELLLGKNFRQGLDILPIMLGAYVLLGINFNLSMWYKLSGKTNYAIYITSVGLLVTLLINLVFMPRYGYHAAAWGHLFSYLVMVVFSAWLGAKHYPIPYNWVKITGYIAIGVALYFISCAIPFPHTWMKWTVNTALLAGFIALWFKWEKLNIRKFIKN